MLIDDLQYILPATYAALLLTALMGLLRLPKQSHVLPVGGGAMTRAAASIHPGALVPAAVGSFLVFLLQTHLARDVINAAPIGLYCEGTAAAWQWLECTSQEASAVPSPWLAPSSIVCSAAVAIALRSMARQWAVLPLALLLCALTALAGVTDLVAAAVQPRGALPASTLLTSFQALQITCAASFGLALCLMRASVVQLARISIATLAVIAFQLIGNVSLLIIWPHVSPALACVLVGTFLILPSVAACSLILASAQ